MSASLYKLPRGESVFNYGGNLVYAGADGWVRASDVTMEKALVKYGATPVGSPSSVDAVGGANPQQIPRDGALGGGVGASTLAAMTDMGTYDLASNNPSITAVKNTANGALPAAQKAAANGVGSLDGNSRQPVTQLGTGIPGAQATGHVFANADNTAHVIATGTPGYVLNTGLMSGWGVSIKGAFTLTGTAAVTDIRTTTGTAFCCIQQTAADGSTYDLVGTK